MLQLEQHAPSFVWLPHLLRLLHDQRGMVLCMQRGALRDAMLQL